MRRNKRIRMLVDYAKQQKIMEPFAKKMEMRNDSVDLHDKDEPPLPQTIQNLNTEKITEVSVTTDSKNRLPDDFQVQPNSDDEPIAQNNPKMELEIITKRSETTNGKKEALDDCQEKLNYTRRRSLSSSSSSSSCSTCSTCSSTSSSSSNSSSSSSSSNSVTLKNQHLSVSLISHESTIISDSQTSEDQSVKPLCDDLIPQSNTSKIIKEKKSPDQIENANNLKTDNNIANDLESMDCADILTATFGDDNIQNKCSSQPRRLSAESTVTESIITQRQEFTPQQGSSNPPTTQIRDEVITQPSSSILDSTEALKQTEGNYPSFSSNFDDLKSQQLSFPLRSHEKTIISQPVTEDQSKRPLCDGLITKSNTSKIIEDKKSPDQTENTNNLESDNKIANDLDSTDCEDISSGTFSDDNVSNKYTSQPRRLSTESTASESIIIQKQSFALQQGNSSNPLTSEIRNELMTQPSTSKYAFTKASIQMENENNAETGNAPTDLDTTDTADFSPDDGDDDYVPEKRKRLSKSHRLLNRLLSDSDSTASESLLIPEFNNELSNDNQNIDESPAESPNQNRKKRKRNVNNWIKTKTKRLKNSGQQYISRTGKIVPAKVMKPACPDKCKFKCSQHFTEEQRREIFNMYWALSSLQRQRDFLNSAVNTLQLSYRQLKPGLAKNKKPFTACFLVNDGKNVRVCKKFLLNTLGIADRTLRTVIESKTKEDYLGVAPTDKRGKHGNQHTIDPEVRESVKKHINSIPRIESHYLRAHTTREYIDGGLTVADLYRDYKKIRESNNQVPASCDAYYRIFNYEFNISFFVPKKDQCDLCESYKNAIDEDKESLEEKYNEHLRQKELSRDEKTKDVAACTSAGSNEIVAFYDLQAVLPVPIGESSAFFYKSKLNCLNLTISDVKNDHTVCYFWHEALGSRGPNEIGSCVFKFLQDVSEKQPDNHIILYSDNCGGQQKNKYIFSMYLYAVTVLRIKSITHKFLIRGHTQNEGDYAHSIIERAIKQNKKSGPIYVPDQYVQIMRNAKKNGKPFAVVELNYDDFYDLKELADEVGLNTGKDVQGKTIKTNEIRMIQFNKDCTTYKYKTKYEDDWTEAEIKIRPRRISTRNGKDIRDISLKTAYSSRIELSENKQKDLKELIQKNIIPRYYSTFYQNIF